MAVEPLPRKQQKSVRRSSRRPAPRGRTSDYSSLRRPEPKNAWEKLLRRLRPPRRLKFTREGKYFLGITLGVGFAAINTGNNLLYLLLGMLLSLIVLSGVMSELSLRDLNVVRRLPTRAQVGRAHLVEIEVFNRKKRIPSYAIEVEDLRAGQPADKRCFFLKISPNSAQVAAYRRSPQRRGRDCHVGFRIATRFPFGLFEKSREVPCEGELIIYPAVDSLRLRSDEGGRRLGGTGFSGRGAGDEVFGLRPMREGDDPRDIYWRKSTLLDQLVLRERARETRPDIELVLEVRRPAEGGDDWAMQFERRIRDVASRAVAHLKRGDGVTIAATSGDRVRADRSVGADRLLRFLALVDAVDATALGGIPEPRNIPQASSGPATPAPPSSNAPISGATQSIATPDAGPPSGPPSGLRSPPTAPVKS